LKINTHSRRVFLLNGAVSVVTAAPFLNVRAQDVFTGGDASSEVHQQQGFWERPRWVWLKRPATGEQIKRVYWKDGQIIPQAYSDISWFLRDMRFQRMLALNDPHIQRALDRGTIGTEHLSPYTYMDPVLLDILYAYSAWLHVHGVHVPLTVTSGFRHLITNAMTEGAAFDSWHVKGGATDIVVPGIRPEALASFGRWLSGGGVGLYARQNFIHIDRGRVRSWTG
jgi:uncharacterized protein YcbK (DUF882 family)